MEKDILLGLWNYDAWANERILAAAAGLPPEALYQPLASGHGTLIDTLRHLFLATHTWRVRAETGHDPDEASEYETSDLAVLAALIQADATAMRSLLEALPSSALAEPMRYITDEGRVVRERLRWHVFVHMVTHGTYHRGELAAALTALGHSPGELDFSVFFPSKIIEEV